MGKCFAAIKRFVSNSWVVILVSSILSGIGTKIVDSVCDSLRPEDPVKKKLMEREDLYIKLAEKMTGKVDEESVNKVKSDLIAYLSTAMTNYTTKAEFERGKNRLVDKEQGVIYELKMSNGGLHLLVEEPITNETNGAKRPKGN